MIVEIARTADESIAVEFRDRGQPTRVFSPVDLDQALRKAGLAGLDA